ncbi:MAG TPA: hypothetical protein VLG49_04755 [Rhabdochlamydiaceae bacterium]|nr:hypothetical protein [Rhabdochlamydiaceae bacterium]
MRYFKILVHSILLLTTPFLLHYPVPVHAETVQCKKQKDSIITYDEILHLLHDLENGELEKRCSQADLERINQFLAILANEGILPNQDEQTFILKKDIHELLQEKEDPYLCYISFDRIDGIILSPTFYHSREKIFLYRNWTKKDWNHTKTFVKNHKKEILIGAAIVVGATVGIYTIAEVSIVGARMQEKALSKSEKEGYSESKEQKMR